MSSEAKIETRLHVENALESGASVGLDPGRAHFLRSVLRLGPGATVALFNAEDGEWAARIDALGKGWCSLEVIAQRRKPEPDCDLWLVFAPIKRARLDFLVEKATELGVSALQPVMTRRTSVERVNLERLRANTREAAEQCERLSLPEVFQPVKLAALLERWPAERRLLVCSESRPGARHWSMFWPKFVADPEPDSRSLRPGQLCADRRAALQKVNLTPSLNCLLFA